jgi:excisionase family DNA binding protein
MESTTRVPVQHAAPAPRALTIKEAAGYVGGTVWAIRQLIWRGQLAYTKIGSRFVIQREALDAWLLQNQQRAGKPARG